MTTMKPKRKTFSDGLLLAQQIAREIAQEWQEKEHPDWSGGVEAAKQIEKRLAEITKEKRHNYV